MKTLKTATIDAYIASAPAEVKDKLEELRAIIRKAAPGAEEVISYAMPTFRQHGNLVHFAAHKSHIGFYPLPEGIEAFAEEAAPWVAGKGTLRFPNDKPLPRSLITRIVKLRLQENLARKKKKS